jgi:alpha-beta hydrolase superfamily lysophospholipase
MPVMNEIMPPRRRAHLTSLIGAALFLILGAANLHAESRDAVLSRDSLSVEILHGRAPGRSLGVLVMSSGDAGWHGLAKDLGATLAGRGYDVIGVDSKAYLIAGTKRSGALTPDAVQEDYLRLVQTARNWFPDRPVFLAGVSEGAGLSILAAASPRVAAEIAGVLGLGTPDTVTLGWHFWNWTVWVTHKEPDEPSVATAPYLAALAPTPVLLIHSTHDEYVAVDTARELFAHARDPRRLAVLDAPNHSFSDARAPLLAAVLEGLRWFRQRGEGAAEVRP